MIADLGVVRGVRGGAGAIADLRVGGWGRCDRRFSGGRSGVGVIADLRVGWGGGCGERRKKHKQKHKRDLDDFFSGRRRGGAGVIADLVLDGGRGGAGVVADLRVGGWGRCNRRFKGWRVGPV